MEVIYEDNHLIAVNKTCHDIVQGDKTGDAPLSEMLKAYLKDKYAKTGNVFVGVTHRLDRPVTGVVVFAKTGKALARTNALFSSGNVEKIYWAIVKNRPPEQEGTLTHWLVRNKIKNKCFAYKAETSNAKKAVLHYRVISYSDHYYLLEINLETGRHHQIRSQLANIGCPVKGDLKYGAERSNSDGGISLHARSIRFTHPVSNEIIHIVADTPDENLWRSLTANL